ncbi:MAG: DMT family transporter, partial [Pseudomonadota bacterium]
MRSPYAIVVVAIALGVVLDVIVKFVALELSVLTLTFWRFFFGSTIAISIYKLRKQPLPTWKAFRFHAMRAAVQVVTAGSFFWALTQLALAEATTIGFTAALFIPPLGRMILKERLSAMSVGAAIVGFAAAAFALSAGGTGAPEEGNRLYGALAAFTAAFGYALTIILLRLRTKSDSTELLALFGNVMPMVYLGTALTIASVFAPSMNSFEPGVGRLPWLALLGLLGFVIWWLMSIAYRDVEAQRLAPFEYLALPMSVLGGFLVFGEAPHWRLYVGAAVIIAACLAVAFEARWRPRRPVSDLLT